jgi:hypothetical protein
MLLKAERGAETFQFCNNFEHNAPQYHCCLSVPDNVYTKYLLQKLFNIKKIFYFTDGAPSQYKNRNNFANICHHFMDFGIEVDWNLFASLHGKNACDGLAGTIKRLAAKAQCISSAIIDSAHKLFVWAQRNIPGIVFEYATKEQYTSTEDNLKSRFENLKTIEGKLIENIFKN